ncbi:MAG: hypothetical protein HEQ37_00800 [Acidovorax sp.]|nr:hypothetical protein [Acidovorax sp.]
MQDFASAAMVRLLVRAMAAHGLVPPPPPPGADGLAASHVPLAYKRSVVEAVLHQGGLGTLLQLAQRVDLLAGDPVHRALLGATGVPELMARWQRLEQYVHSRHQVSTTASAPGTLALRHHARPGVREAPHPTESLAVLGALLGASQALGVRGLQVEIGTSGTADRRLEPAAGRLCHRPRRTARAAGPTGCAGVNGPLDLVLGTSHQHSAHTTCPAAPAHHPPV